MAETAKQRLKRRILETRRSFLSWFQRHGYWSDEETREATRGPANVLQCRAAAHYEHCQRLKIPCRMLMLKYRRAGSSTIGAGLNYVHQMNYNARTGVIGMDYKASSNMMEMVKFFARHDDFPGWGEGVGKIAEDSKETVEWVEPATDIVPFEQRVTKEITTKIVYSHGSSCELYTAENEKSARSAGLQSYHATEVAFWPMGGVRDAGKTLTAMRNTLPKKGFHLAIEESTANGATGEFYANCRGARWPGYADWWKKWETCWPLSASEFGPELQFVFIFAAWFEDSRHVLEITGEQRKLLEETLDEDERTLMKLYTEEGPRGPRLGGEVDATVWEQLAWRRMIIDNVCKRGGADEFKQEYPSNPLEAFRSSGRPVFDNEGMTAIELRAQELVPETGTLTKLTDNSAGWGPMPANQAIFERWEAPMVGAKYIISVDPMSGADQITGSGVKDRHSVLVFRDACRVGNKYRRPRLVARIRPPCQFDTGPLARLIWLLSLYYGNCCIIVESNAGIHLITELRDKYNANLFHWEDFDKDRQQTTHKLGWRNTEESRRLIVETMQFFVREQRADLGCKHLAGECRSFIINNAGKAIAGGSAHDDDVIATAMGLTYLSHATEYRMKRLPPPESPDARAWKDA